MRRSQQIYDRAQDRVLPTTASPEDDDWEGLNPVTDVLFGLQKEFPGFRIWQECHGDRKRYVACRLLASTRPHSVVTADPDELRDALSRGPGPGNKPNGG